MISAGFIDQDKSDAYGQTGAGCSEYVASYFFKSFSNWLSLKVMLEEDSAMGLTEFPHSSHLLTFLTVL